MANLSNINGYFNVTDTGLVNVVNGGLYVTKNSGDAIIGIISSGGNGRPYYLRSNTSGNFAIYDDTACLERLTIASGGDVTMPGNVTIGNSAYGSSLGQLRIINDAASNPASLSLFGYNNVADNTDFAIIEFAMQSSGTGGNVLASIKAQSDGTSENAADLRFGTANVTTGLTEKMRIDSSGNVGIGTPLPSDLLHLKKSSGDTSLRIETVTGGDPTIYFNSLAANRSGMIKYQDNGTNVGRIQYVHNGDRIAFQAGSATGETMSINNNAVGIGATLPATKLQVANAGEVIVRSSMTAADGYRCGFEADNQHTGGTIWSMFSTNNSDGYFGGGKFVIANETMGDVDVNTPSKFVIDGAGSVLIGDGIPSGTPEADYRSLEIGRQGNTITGAPWKSNLYLTCNATITAGSSAFTYRYASEAPARMDLEDGNVTFYNAAAGTVGDTISWSERMRIASGGDVLISTNGKFLQGKRNTGSAVIDMIGFGAGTDTLQIKGGTSGAANAISFYDTGGFVGTFYNGNFGIGVTNPDWQLEVSDSGTVRATVVSTLGPGTAGVYFKVYGDGNLVGNGTVRTDSAGTMSFFTGTSGETERMRILGSGVGAVMIRRASSIGDYFLQVGDASLDNGYPIYCTVASTAGRTQINFSNYNNNSVGSISTSGSATSFNTSSDYRLKEDLKEFNGLDIVSQIKTYDFKWKNNDDYEDCDKRGYGVIAHEIETILPQIVKGKKDEVNKDGSINPQGVDYAKIVPLLVKSIQELKAEIEQLKTQINN